MFTYEVTLPGAVQFDGLTTATGRCDFTMPAAGGGINPDLLGDDVAVIIHQYGYSGTRGGTPHNLEVLLIDSGVVRPTTFEQQLQDRVGILRLNVSCGRDGIVVPKTPNGISRILLFVTTLKAEPATAMCSWS